MAWRIATSLNAITIFVVTMLCGLVGGDPGSIGATAMILGSPFLALLLMTLSFRRSDDATAAILVCTVCLGMATFCFVTSIFPPPVGRPVPPEVMNCGPPVAVILLFGQWVVVAILLAVLVVAAIVSRLWPQKAAEPASKPIPFDPDWTQP